MNLPPVGPAFRVVVLALACFALLPNARAVNPPPIGGYPGGNTAEGQSALLNLTTGTFNAGIGLFSLLDNATGNFNTGVGAGTLLSNRRFRPSKSSEDRHPPKLPIELSAVSTAKSDRHFADYDEQLWLAP